MFFYIPTVYKNKKNNISFFQHENNKIMHLSQKCIGKIIEAELVEQDNKFNIYHCRRVVKDAERDDFDFSVFCQAAIIKETSKYLIGGALISKDGLEAQQIREKFPNYVFPEYAYPFVKITKMGEFGTALHKSEYVANVLIYYATENMLYAHPINLSLFADIYREDIQNAVQQIKFQLSLRDPFVNARSLLREVQQIYKDSHNFKYNKKLVEFKSNGHRYLIDIEKNEVFQDGKEVCVRCGEQLCREDQVIAKVLTIINNPSAISTLSNTLEEE